MQTWYLCLFHTQVYCIVCIFPHVTQKCVVLTLSIPRYHFMDLASICVIQLSCKKYVGPANV
jgi:hypothetical protein